MYKSKRELKNCLLVSLILLIALTALLLINNDGSMATYKSDNNHTAVVKTETSSR